MRKTVAACLTAALVLGSVGGAVAQERGYQGYGAQSVSPKNVYRDGNGQYRNRGSDDRYRNNKNGNRYGQAPGHANRGNAKRGYVYRGQVYRGQVHRNRQGWQSVPPAYAHRYRAGPGHRYYRVGNDVVLVAIATGLVLNVLHNAIR